MSQTKIKIEDEVLHLNNQNYWHLQKVTKMTNESVDLIFAGEDGTVKTLSFEQHEGQTLVTCHDTLAAELHPLYPEEQDMSLV